jgi:hypothetical protein
LAVDILGTADAGPLPEETVVQYHPAAAGVVLRMPDMALPHSLRKIREPHAAGFRNILNLLRLLMTYIIPLLVVGGLILCGLWIVPDILFGMYANIDGKWMSWNHRSIMEWSSFLNFAPYSPFSGTGSLFLPNLPWLNPGALALALPGPIEYKHLLSYFVYLTELTLSMYFLFLELKLERAYAFTAVLLYIAFFFVPFNSVSGAPSWYSLAPFFAHQAAAMNLATVALLRAGQSTLLRNVVWGLVFIACLFIAFSSAPTFNLIYVPVYAVFWTILAFSSELDRRALPFRIGLVLCTAAVFSIIGLPGYLSVTAAVSARDSNLPAFLHPGMALLTVDYWRGLISRFSTCSGDQALFLICVSRSPVAWVQIAALLAGAVMIVFDSGRRRALAITVVTMIFLLHFYYLMTIDNVLGPAHIVGYTYLYWTLYPLLFAVAVAGIATIVRRGLPDGASVVRWIPAVANTGISIVLLMIFIEVIAVRQPRVAGEGVLGFRPIAHIGVRKGPIHRYLEEHAALAPGKEFRGYVGLYLGADDGFVRKLVPIPNGAMAHETYVVARQLLANEFGNMLHLTDLWNSNIPTFEDYGQWTTKQMFMFDGDLLAGDEDFVDRRAHTTHIYKFDPKILALLGVRFVVSDGTVTSPLVTEVLRETSTAGTLRLYELENVNLGNFSPTEAVTADSYDDAVSRLRNLQGRDTVILLGPLSLPPSLVPATQARLIVEKGGYHVSAQSRESSLLVLPVQFSHCWQLVPRAGGKAIAFRANIIQTGIFFQGGLDADLRFGFGLTNSSCRRQDAGDMAEYLSSTQSHRYKHYLTPPE